jgi:hypothetical protein
MPRNGSAWDNFDTPLEVQPPPQSAEGPVDYGGFTIAARKGDFRDPLGVLPEEARLRNIGPPEGEG